MKKQRAKYRFLHTERGPMFGVDVHTGERTGIGVTREMFATLAPRDQLAALRGLRLQPDPRRRG